MSFMKWPEGNGYRANVGAIVRSLKSNHEILGLTIPESKFFCFDPFRSRNDVREMLDNPALASRKDISSN